MVYLTNSSGSYYQASFVIDVKGSPFTSLELRALSTVASTLNPIVVRITPVTTIDVDDQLVLEIPTKSLDGLDLMDEDGGQGYSLVSGPTFDLFAGDISSMKCRFEPGCRSCPTPLRIICSEFSQAITSSRELAVVFLLRNPAVAALKTITLPLVLYSLDLASGVKTNWDVVEAGLVVRGANPSATTTVSDTGNFALSDTGYDDGANTLTFSLRNSKQLEAGDYYFLQLGFGLRNSGQQTSAWSYGATSFGVATSHAYFLANCRCLLLPFPTAFPAQPAAGTTLSGRIQSVVNNQYYQLSSAERAVSAIASYRLAKASQNIVYTDLYPALTTVTLASPSVSFASLRGNTEVQADEDYQIGVTFSTTSTGTTMQYAKKVAIILPASVFTSFNSVSCVEGLGSGLQVQECRIQGSAIWVSLVQSSSYTNNQGLVIRTSGRAMRNPAVTSFDRNTITARVFTWPDSIPEPALSTTGSDYVLFALGSTTSSTFTFASAASYSVFRSAWVEEERTNDDWEPSSSQRTLTAPLRLTFLAPASFPALTAGSHSIKLGISGLAYPTASNSGDMAVNALRCYINKELVKSCSISGTNVVVSHQLEIASGARTGLLVQFENPSDKTSAGFSYAGTDPFKRFRLELAVSGGSTYLVETLPVRMYYQLSTTNYPFFAVSSATYSLAHRFAGQPNLVEFSLTFTRSDVEGLVF